MKILVHILILAILSLGFTPVLASGTKSNVLKKEAVSIEDASCCSKSNTQEEEKEEDSCSHDSCEDSEDGCCGDDCGCNCCMHGTISKVVCKKEPAHEVQEKHEVTTKIQNPNTSNYLISSDYRLKLINPPRR